MEKIEIQNKKSKMYSNIIEQYNTYIYEIKNPDIDDLGSSINNKLELYQSLAFDIKLILEQENYHNIPVFDEKYVKCNSDIEDFISFIENELIILKKKLCIDCNSCLKYKYKLYRRIILQLRK